MHFRASSQVWAWSLRAARRRSKRPWSSSSRRCFPAGVGEVGCGAVDGAWQRRTDVAWRGRQATIWMASGRCSSAQFQTPRGAASPRHDSCAGLGRSSVVGFDGKARRANADGNQSCARYRGWRQLDGSVGPKKSPEAGSPRASGRGRSVSAEKTARRAWPISRVSPSPPIALLAVRGLAHYRSCAPRHAGTCSPRSEGQ